MKTWLIICNASEARVYDISKKENSNTPLHTLEHPEGKAKGIDLVSDRPGHFGNRGSSAVSEYTSRTNPHETECTDFALRLAEFLDSQLANAHFQKVIVCAEPHFLGILKKHLSNPVIETVNEYISKDYIPLDTKHLDHVMTEIKYENLKRVF